MIDKLPLFIQKLLKMLEDKTSNNLIRWSQDGKSFVILNIPKFENIVLPILFKKQKFISFHRQLNAFSFQRINRKLKKTKEFEHPYFIRGEWQQMQNITHDSDLLEKDNCQKEMKIK
jgi:hypothetical protein